MLGSFSKICVIVPVCAISGEFRRTTAATRIQVQIGYFITLISSRSYRLTAIARALQAPLADSTIPGEFGKDRALELRPVAVQGDVLALISTVSSVSRNSPSTQD